ncbi:MAG: FumA C-terminus/TtdB family hydratase beta subunit [archaeon]
MEIISLSTPPDEKKIRKLKVGEIVSLSGTIFCARDRIHKYYYDNIDKVNLPNLSDSVIYHCGPLVKKTKEGYNLISAGPTTSMRMSAYLPRIIEKYKIKAIIGKGGLDNSLLNEFNKFGCVYLSVIGGLGAVVSQKITKVESVHFMEFGMPEAMWKLKVSDMQAIVTMDTHFNSLHEDILRKSIANRERIVYGHI